MGQCYGCLKREDNCEELVDLGSDLLIYYQEKYGSDFAMEKNQYIDRGERIQLR